MKINAITFEELQRPAYILDETKLRSNLSLIAKIAKEADIEIILAFKAYALWKTFPIFREYINATTASSLNEAKLGYYEFGAPTHTFSPAYTDYEINEIAKCSSHLVFNSFSQFNNFHLKAKQANNKISIGLRINPEYSEVETLLYNPCAPGTRFGVSADKLPTQLPTDIEGFHIHCHCENGSDVFERTLQHVEKKLAPWFKQIKWINFGGGHLMTRKNYDTKLLINILSAFKSRYPWLKVILEPGSAFAWQTGPLVSEVVDIVEDKGIKTAILNVSFTCHMPDCLEMPYWPAVRGGRTLEEGSEEAEKAKADATSYIYRLGGNSCLSGDFMSSWQFDHELEVGEKVIFEDMLHYTTVKTCMFNGIRHPSIAMLHEDGDIEILRRYSYEDYRNMMD